MKVRALEIELLIQVVSSHSSGLRLKPENTFHLAGSITGNSSFRVAEFEALTSECEIKPTE
jgi:hypothetical protein